MTVFACTFTMREASPEARPPTLSMDHRIVRTIAYMTGNLHRKLTLTDLAQQVNLSPTHLRLVFKSEIGTSPMQHLKVLRMERAKTLLETTFLTVKEVMAQVGVFDKSHFVSDFKRSFKLTPTEHRRRYRNL